MRPLLSATIFCCLALLCAPAFSQDSAAINKVLDDQQAAWNHGDIDTFMQGYNNSPETTFIGKSIEHGYAVILARYKKSFPSRAAMGALAFTGLNVKMLGQNYAVVTGNFHLARTAAGGGDASGVYSLIFEREPQGWRIILDHTTS